MRDDDGGRKPRLTREAIVERAREQVARDGLASLSMRSLAASLDVQAMSLYHHFVDRDDLVDAVIGRLLADVTYEPHPDEDWSVDATALSTAIYHTLLDYPGVAAHLSDAALTDPTVMPLIDAALEITSRIPIGVEWRLAFFRTAVRFVMASAMIEEASAQHQLRSWRMNGGFDAHRGAEYEAAKRMARVHARTDGERGFALGLDLIVRGVQALVDEQAATPPAPPA